MRRVPWGFFLFLRRDVSITINTVNAFVESCYSALHCLALHVFAAVDVSHSRLSRVIPTHHVPFCVCVALELFPATELLIPE